MANTIPQHGTSQSSQSQQQAGVAGQPQGQLGGMPNAATQSSASGIVEKFAQTADETTHRAIERVQETRDRARSGIEAQQAQLGGKIRDVGDALRSSGRKLEDNEAVASLLNVASDQVDRLASYVDSASPRSVAADLHNFARDRPAWFFGGAFLAGLALGRFAKSSAQAVSGEGPSQGSRMHSPGRSEPTAEVASSYAARSPARPTTSGYASSGAGGSTASGATSGSASSGGYAATPTTPGSSTPSGYAPASPGGAAGQLGGSSNRTLTGTGTPGAGSKGTGQS